MPYGIKEVFEVVSELGNLGKLNPQVDTTQKLKIFSPFSSTNHILFKQVWPTAARDMINFTHWRLLEDGRIIVLSFNCEEYHEKGAEAYVCQLGKDAKF